MWELWKWNGNSIFTLLTVSVLIRPFAFRSFIRNGHSYRGSHREK